MTKFGDKLKRLHSSRVRANEENKNHSNVYIGDNDSSFPKNDRSRTKTTPQESVKRTAIKVPEKFSSILRAGKLEQKSSVKQEKNRVYSLRQTEVKKKEETTSALNTVLGNRLKDLRIQASALITAGRSESALPLLYEMIAFAPDNLFALSKLEYYFRPIERDLAQVFADRIARLTQY